MRWLSSLLVIAVLGLSPVLAHADRVHGVLLMEGSRKVDRDRFKMRKDWDRVLIFYKRLYGKKDGYSWRFFADTPRVRAVHIGNLGKKKWEGINIYETSDGVFVYVIEASSEDGA